MDATQEMIALGMCNVLGSFFKSIPTCGAFTRSAVSNASGVQTPFSGLYSAIMTLLALTLLAPYFNFIPKATLAAILICAVISLVKTTCNYDRICYVCKNFYLFFRLILKLHPRFGKRVKWIFFHGLDVLSLVWRRVSKLVSS